MTSRCRPKEPDRGLRVLTLGLLLLLSASSAGSVIRAPAARAATSLPPGFVIEPVVSGLDLPTAISFTNDGRMFIAQKNGVIRVFRDGALLPTPFIDLSADVNSFRDRGLVGMTTHPEFPQTPYLYVLYTYDPPGVTKDGVGARVARLERIAANLAQPDVAATGPGARTVLLGRNGDASVITNPNANATLTCWRNSAIVGDCIPQDSSRHAIGTVEFGPDGALYVGNGDSDRLPNGPQQIDTSIGAILRLDPVTGNGLPSNPFYDGDPTSNASKTWLHGLRNPFRFGMNPVTGEMLIADVGESSWESIHRGQAGMNYGWPCYEGGNHVYGVYQNTALCQAIYAQGPRNPVYTYSHAGTGASVTGGDWYQGTAYPEEYRGAYFFADTVDDWVRYLAPNGNGGYVARDFASGDLTSGIVHLVAGPDSNLHWVSIGNGTVYRLRFTSSPTLPPLVLSLNFDEGSGTMASDGSALGNHAELRNGATWGSGRLGGGLAVDGVNDFATVPSSSSLGGFTDAFTVSAWVQRPATQTGWRAVVSRQLTTTSSDQFYLSFSNGQPRFGLNTTSGGNQFVGSGTAALGGWVHLAGVYDGSAISLYVDGALRASMHKTGSILSSSRPVVIAGNANGTDPLATTEHLAGSVDEIRLYARVLSPGEIAALANPGTPPQVTILNPPNDVVADVGTTIQFSATASDPNDGDLTDEIAWKGILHHNVHTHPDYLEPTTGGSGSVELDDHGDDTFLELCAEVSNSVGLSATDCVEVHPRTMTVTIDSVPQGVPMSFEDITQATPFTVVANVGGTRTLSAPQSSGCLTFGSWSDGGAATHDIVVGASPRTFTASYTGSCGPGPNLLRNPGFENNLTGWPIGTIVTSPVHSGTKALQIEARSSGARTSTQTVAVTGGTTYQASGWVSVANLARTARIFVQWRNASGTLLRSDTFGTLTGTVGWSLRSATLTAPSDARQAWFMLRTDAEPDNSGRAWFDDLSLG